MYLLKMQPKGVNATILWVISGKRNINQRISIRIKTFNFYNENELGTW